MRRSGKTTRLVDAAIQELFTEGVLYLPTQTLTEQDKFGFKKDTKFFYDQDYVEGNRAQREFIRQVEKRLQHEHGDCVEREGRQRLIVFKVKPV